MKVRSNAHASQHLNFTQVKQASKELQDPRYSDLLKGTEGQQMAEVARKLTYVQNDYRNGRLHAKDSFQNCLTLGVVASVSGLTAALAGHPAITSLAALVAAGAGWGTVNARMQAQSFASKEKLVEDLNADLAKAGENLAASMVSEGSDPGHLTDRRYFTGGVLKNLATVHSRDSGLALRVRAEVVGSHPYQLESDLVERKVSIRSPQGECTFPGWLQIGDKELVIHRSDPKAPHAGSLTQTIRADGESRLGFTPRSGGGSSVPEITTSSIGPGEGFLASAYCWEKGQIATFVRDRLVVATPVIPLQELSPSKVRVLPEGVVGAYSQVDGVKRAVECSFPESYGLGTWCSTTSYTSKPRWVESQIGSAGVSICSDDKLGSFRARAADGSTLEGRGTLVFNEGAYRLEQSQAAGTVKQSLLAGEVLLQLRGEKGNIRLQHRSGQSPRAVFQADRNFQEEARELPVVLTEQGRYLVRDGQQQLELEPPLPLYFLEKCGSAYEEKPGKKS